MTWQERYLARYYDRAKGWRDGTELFHGLCRRVLPPGSRVLEIGAGPSNATSRFLADFTDLHGLDPDPAVRTNDALASAEVLGADGAFPYPDASFDGCVSNYVVEHVAEPASHLAEVGRVLRPGGAYVFRAPNRFHYVTIASALTPHWVHERIANRLRDLPREAHDPYPTVYRMNSRRRIRRLAREAGFDVEHLEAIEREPMYGLSSRVLFFLFLAYERAVNSTALLADLRVNLLAVLRKR